MSEYKRKCSECNVDIIYNSISSLKSATNNNSKCNSCRSRRYPIETEFKRNCPQCNDEIHYKDRGSKNVADKKNSVCATCRLCWIEDRYGTKVYEYECPCKNCGQLKQHHSKKGITKQAVEKLQKNPTRLCRSCSNSLYYTPASSRTNTKPELEVKKWLDANKINYIQQYPISGSHYDFYLPDYSILIEVDGCYWHGKDIDENKLNKQQKNVRNNDLKKNLLAEQHNIPILRVWEDEINSIFFNKIKNTYV